MAAESEDAGLRDSACDELYAIGGEQAGRSRRVLLKLRRDIYNNWPVDALPSDAAALPAVAAWFAAHQRAELAATALEHGHAAFLDQERQALVEVLGNDSFRQSLARIPPPRWTRSTGTAGQPVNFRLGIASPSAASSSTSPGR